MVRSRSGQPLEARKYHIQLNCVNTTDPFDPGKVDGIERHTGHPWYEWAQRLSDRRSSGNGDHATICDPAVARAIVRFALSLECLGTYQTSDRLARRWDSNQLLDVRMESVLSKVVSHPCQLMKKFDRRDGNGR